MLLSWEYLPPSGIVTVLELMMVLMMAEIKKGEKNEINLGGALDKCCISRNFCKVFILKFHEVAVEF